MNRNFKLREQDYKAMQGMTEKEAGQFIKGLCGYAFDGVNGNERREDRKRVCVCKGRTGHFGAEPRERQKRRAAHGGAYAQYETDTETNARNGR